MRVKGSDGSIYAFGDAATIEQPKALEFADELFEKADKNKVCSSRIEWEFADKFRPSFSSMESSTSQERVQRLWCKYILLCGCMARFGSLAIHVRSSRSLRSQMSALSPP